MAKAQNSVITGSAKAQAVASQAKTAEARLNEKKNLLNSPLDEKTSELSTSRRSSRPSTELLEDSAKQAFAAAGDYVISQDENTKGAARIGVTLTGSSYAAIKQARSLSKAQALTHMKRFSFNVGQLAKINTKATLEALEEDENLQGATAPIKAHKQLKRTKKNLKSVHTHLKHLMQRRSRKLASKATARMRIKQLIRRSIVKLGGVVKAAVAKVIALFSPWVLGILGALFGLFILVALITSVFSANTQGLNPQEALIAQYFLSQGFTPQATAGIMGNMKQESNYDPACHQAGGPGRGLLQWEIGSSRFANLVNFAASRGLDWTDTQAQLDFIMLEAPSQFNMFTGKGKNGIYRYSTGAVAWLEERMTFAEYGQLTDVDWATEAFERVYPRASIPRMDARKAEAWRIYMILTNPQGTGVISDGKATPRMMQVATLASNNACSAWAIGGQCASWVSHVLQQAGCPYPYWNAIDYWELSPAWAKHTDLSNMPPGAIIVSSSGGSAAGNQYGHVAIYLGNNMVVSNVGGLRHETLQSYASWQRGVCKGTYQGIIGWVWAWD